MNKKKIKYLFHVVSHPFDGFYEVRHREQGSVLLALILILLFGLSFSLNRQYAGFVVNDINPRTVNTVTEVIAIFAFVLLFSTANWSITCLMEGEGRFKDILTITGYSMTPMVLTFLPATLISQFIASGEEAFYYLLLFVSIGWFVILLLIGVMTIHNFTIGKTMITLCLTCVSMLVIIFLLSLLLSLVQQVYLFLESIYTEILFRI
ncbi:Yip1 family protein [Anaeromicropila populeti]|uniref:Yip1 domain-containing protein n=1 Tax=Anaeromicropila populeti TaxID=37658 RepID=A0A1I6LJW0_9FIRM|nr:Yip1 family protein [Anaeromicropila populeti]SFS03775.1 Yip1 domain-containing protein [Anaeromicropila populeti]